ncbi:phage recombination protein Bet [Aquilutibacter rugosus]
MNAQLAPMDDKKSLIKTFGERYEIAPSRVLATLKSTAFKLKSGEVTEDQMIQLLVVANQYGLNPFTREIFAFPDKQNGVTPVVGVDGWSRIINSNSQFDGMEFSSPNEMVRPDGALADCPEWLECRIYRKDRSRPTVVREYLDEVYRPAFKSKEGYTVNGPWQSHPKRFLRHKAMIQCARLAFGFVGIYDQDEAERIREADVPLIQQSSNVSDLMPKAKAEPKPAEVTDDAEFVDTDDADTEHMPVIDLSLGALKVLEKKARLVGKSMDDVIAQFAPIHAGNITGVLQALK